MKTRCVRADSSQALTSDIRSFVFLKDSSESPDPASRISCGFYPQEVPGIFLLFPNAEVPFAIPQKGIVGELYW